MRIGKLLLAAPGVTPSGRARRMAAMGRSGAGWTGGTTPGPEYPSAGRPAAAPRCRPGRVRRRPARRAGRAGISDDVTGPHRAFSDIDVIVADMVAEHDKVATRVIARGTHLGPLPHIPPTARRTAVMGHEIWRLADRLTGGCLLAACSCAVRGLGRSLGGFVAGPWAALLAVPWSTRSVCSSASRSAAAVRPSRQPERRG